MAHFSRFVLICVTAASLSAADIDRGRNAKTQPLSIEKQGSFFVGGHDIHSDALLNLAGSTEAGTITVDQIYVHYQMPVAAKRHSVTLIHGCCLTGKTWETTPDGRMGWDEYFVRKGYSTYVIDQAARGRSAGDTTAIERVKLGKVPPDQLPSVRETAH